MEKRIETDEQHDARLINRTYECHRNPEPDWPSNQWLVIVREGDEVVERFHCEDGPRWVASEKSAIAAYVGDLDPELDAARSREGLYFLDN